MTLQWITLRMSTFKWLEQYQQKGNLGDKYVNHTIQDHLLDAGTERSKLIAPILDHTLMQTLGVRTWVSEWVVKERVSNKGHLSPESWVHETRVLLLLLLTQAITSPIQHEKKLKRAINWFQVIDWNWIKKGFSNWKTVCENNLILVSRVPRLWFGEVNKKIEPRKAKKISSRLT